MTVGTRAPREHASPDVVLDLDDDGIAWLRLGGGRGRPPALDSDLLAGLDAALAALERRAAAGEARIAILVSEAPGLFATDPALERLQEIGEAARGAVWSREGQRVLRRLELLTIPSIAAVQGACLGTGVELALACGYRVAADDGATRLGFPGVRDGVLPGLGGTVRLPRLVGAPAALDLLLSGTLLDTRAARRIGLVDAGVPAASFRDAVRRFAASCLARPRRSARRSLPRRLLEDTAPGRRLVFARAVRRSAAADAPDPAVEPVRRRLLQLVAQEIGLPLDAAFEREAEAFGQLLSSPRTQALLHAARVVYAARAGSDGAGAPRLEQVTVLGGSELASELVYRLASAGTFVRLRDTRRERLGLGLGRAQRWIVQDAQAGRISPAEADRRATLIAGGSGFGGFGTTDLLLTADTEPDAIRAHLREAEEHVREECVIALAAPISGADDVRDALRHPDRLVELHLFRPLELFPLVELRDAERASPAARRTARALAHRLGGSLLCVADREATPAMRLLGAYLSEALRLVDEGATVVQVDRVAEGFGFRMGPFRRLDALGPVVGAHLLERLAGRHDGAMRPPPLLERVRRSGHGFYRYRAGRPVEPNPVLPAGIPDDDGSLAELIRRRLLLRVVNEAARVVEGGAVGVDGVEVAALEGLGFPRLHGGPLFYARRLGLVAVGASLRELAARFGERFAPASLLQPDGGAGDQDVATPFERSGHAAGSVI